MRRDDSDALRKTIEAQEYPPYVVPSVHGGMILIQPSCRAAIFSTLRIRRDDSVDFLMRYLGNEYPPYTEG